jgi:sugar (pentulose or hexulose) kinase
MTRALLEGIADQIAGSYAALCDAAGRSYRQLVGAGNGLRQNPVLAAIVAEKLALSIVFPRHREEAAVGAALIAMIAAGIFADRTIASHFIRFDQPEGIVTSDLASARMPRSGSSRGKHALKRPQDHV